MGGGIPEWILDATISGYNFSASWNYDAETIVMLVTTTTTPVILMYDVATKDMYYADSVNGKWTHYGVDSRVTITPRSILGNYSQVLSYMSIIPIANKPNGYFS